MLNRVMPFWPTEFRHVVPLCLLVVLCISPVVAIQPTIADAAGTQFLEQYAANPDVTELYFGLLYKVPLSTHYSTQLLTDVVPRR